MSGIMTFIAIEVDKRLFKYHYDGFCGDLEPPPPLALHLACSGPLAGIFESRGGTVG